MNLKFIYTSLLVLLTISLPVVSQEIEFRVETNFNNDHSFIEIDTSNPDNIWQIGPPQKELFNEAYTPPNVIITDTINPYPPNNHSSFQFTVTSPDTGFCWSLYTLAFAHKFNTDTLLSGGYIDFSYDYTNWKNIINDNGPGIYTNSYDFYSIDDTIIKGIPAFTGSRTNWIGSQYNWIRADSIAKIDSIIFRFNFLSDTTQSQKDGWMIDGIYFEAHNYCGIDVQESKPETFVRVYPNPSNRLVNFEVDDYYLPYNIIIRNPQGQIIKSITRQSENLLKINCSDFIPGIYFYEIKSKRYFKKGTIIIN